MKKSETNNKADFAKPDKRLTALSLGAVLALSFSFFFLNLQNDTLLEKIFNSLTQDFGGIYLIYAAVVLGIMAWLGFSPWGKISLGEGPPRHSTLSWMSMLFCACIGSSILYWGMIEWAYYLQTPPFGMAPMSEEAAEIAVAYTMFHWGLSGWALYGLAAIIIAYYFFVKKVPVFRISVSCGFKPGKKSRVLSTIIDVFVVVGLCSGAAVSVALGTPMVAQALYVLFGLEPSRAVYIGIAVFWAALFSASATLGVDKGIKRLSNLNSLLALVFIAVVFLCKDPAFIANNAVNSIGVMLQNFARMSFSTEPITQSGFPQVWTVFYWAWWVSYVPVMGLFIAKISQGRTIRQLVLGTTVLGSLGCWLFQTVLGGYGLHLQLTGQVDTVANLSQIGDQAAIMALLQTMPFPRVIIFVFFILAFIFLATTCDSSAFILASVTAATISEEQEPTRFSRLVWSGAIIIWPIVLMAVGGLDVVKLCSIIGSVPLLFIFGRMIWAFFHELKNQTEEGE